MKIIFACLIVVFITSCINTSERNVKTENVDTIQLQKNDTAVEILLKTDTKKTLDQ